MILFAGTSGYGFREWVGRFYPEGAKPGDFLSHYAQVFRSVEINYTFRRFPKPEVVETWAGAVPDGFRFAVKAHQSITHRTRLKDAGPTVRSFVKALGPLQQRLGPVLFQCPPWLRRDDDRLEGFLRELPPGGQFALEFRHQSWRAEAVEDRCRAAGVALVAATDELAAGLRIPVTANFAYVRLRRDPPWNESEFGAVRAALDAVRDRVEALYLYVKHDGAGLAPGAVSALMALDD